MTTTEATEKTKAKTKTVTWRMPVWVANEFAGDWSGFREILDDWAEEAEPVDPEEGEETTSVCMRVNEDTLKKLDREAKRLSKKTRRKWTAGRVARKIYEDLYDKEE
jgi:hypothetical protein